MSQLPATKKVKVVRNFYDHERKLRKCGEVCELPRHFAKEVCNSNKAEEVPEVTVPAPQAAPPVTTGRDKKDKEDKEDRK